MVGEERPKKVQKLSHDADGDEQSMMQTPLPSLQLSSNGQIAMPDKDVSKPVQDAAADSADDQILQSQSLGGSGSGPPDFPLNSSCGDPPMSKNQLRRLRKKQEWEAGRSYRKAKRKEKIAEKKERKRAACREEQAELNPEAEPGPTIQAPKPPSRAHTRLPITFLIDCGFDGLMTERERISLGSQLTRCYSDNHKAAFQAHLVVSSWGGLLKERFDTVLDRHHENWRGVRFVADDFVQAAAMAKETMKGKSGGKLAGAFSSYAPESSRISNDEKQQLDSSITAEKGTPPHTREAEPFESFKLAEEQSGSGITSNSLEAKNSDKSGVEMAAANDSSLRSGSEDGEVIYLTSDSPYTLETLEPYKTYIIGGLVDKNRYKGICYKTACDKGVKTAKLPISQYMEMQSRFVLATNHVHEIMVKWLECGDWGEAFMQVIPKRKGGKLKEDEIYEAEDTPSRGGNSDDLAEANSAPADADGKNI
jgi:tRNA (guanine9-N1)-methyltransferase